MQIDLPYFSISFAIFLALSLTAFSLVTFSGLVSAHCLFSSALLTRYAFRAS